MVSTLEGFQKPVTALVVEDDPAARRRICKVLTKKGIQVSSCSSLSQGRQHFKDQPIVLAGSHGDHGELNGFVDWVREHSGEKQPYIVAITNGGEGEVALDKMEAAVMNPSCDAVIQAPVDEEQLHERLLAIDLWLQRRDSNGDAETPATDTDTAAATVTIATTVVPPSLKPSPFAVSEPRPPVPGVPEPSRPVAFHAGVLVENAPLAMAMFDTEMRYLLANGRWRSEFHLQEVALAGRSHFDVFPNVASAWRRIFEKCLQGSVERCREDLFERPDGTTDWVRWEVRPWRLAGGEIGGIIISSEIITPLKLREARAKFDGEFVSSVMANEASPVMLVDRSGKILRGNGFCQKLFQDAGLEFQRNPYWDLIAVDAQRDLERGAFLTAMATPTDSGECRMPSGTAIHDLKAAHGKTRRFAWTGTPHVNQEGGVEALIRIGIEVLAEMHPAGAPLAFDHLAQIPAAPALGPAETTEPPPPPASEEEWKRREKALLLERDTFLRITHNTPFGIILLDSEGRHVYSNPQHKTVLGFSIEEACDVEDWLRKGCPEPGYADQIIDQWRDSVWRKQLRNVFTLATEEGLLKEIEFSPKLLSDGSLLVSFTDVTEQRRADEAFRASETKFRAFFQGSRAGMALVDRNGVFIDANSAFEKMLGYPRWAMRRKSLAECVHPGDLARLQALQQSLAGDEGGVSESELRLLANKQREIWTRLNASPVKNHEGKLLFTAYTAFDISAQKEAGRQLRESQEQNRALMEAMPDLIVLLDRDANVIDIIPSVDKHLSLDAGRIIEEGFAQDLPELAAHLGELVDQAHGEDQGVVYFEFTSLDGREELRNLEARVVSCGHDHTLVVIGDVTDRERAQAALKRQALVFENIDDAVVLTDLRGRITDFNPAAEHLFGYEKGEVAGKPLFTLYDPDNPKAFNQRISGEINAHHRWEGSTSFRHKDGSEGACEVLYIPVEDKGGASRALVGINRPLGGAEECEFEPHDAGEAQAVLASAGSNGQLNGNGNGDGARAAIDRIHGGVKRDFQVISSLLNLQLASLPDRIGRKMLKENQNRILAISFIYRQLAAGGRDAESIDFAEYLEALAEYLVKASGVDPSLVEIDIRFRQMPLPVEKAVLLGLIANELLSNALRHGFPDQRQGFVAVDLEETGDGAAVLKIIDNGVGLPTAFNLDNPSTLGLQIAKILVDRLQGRIEIADSIETEFVVRFPFDHR